MGRVKDFKELGRKGPGRKARKQSPPSLKHVQGKVERTSEVAKVLGGRIKQRSRKRLLKEELVKSRKGGHEDSATEESKSVIPFINSLGHHIFITST